MDCPPPPLVLPMFILTDNSQSLLLPAALKLPPKIILPLAAQHYIAIYPTQYIASAFDSLFSASYQPYFFTVPIL